MKLLLIAVLAGAAAVGFAQTVSNDAPFDDLVFGAAVSLDASESMPRDVFPAAEHQAGFTVLAGVTNVRMADGILTFVLTAEPALLGWGNYQGRWPDCRIRDYPVQFDAVLRGRQSVPCEWTVRFKDPMLTESWGGVAKGRPAGGKAWPLVFSGLRSGGKRRYDPTHTLAGAGPSTGSLEFRVQGAPGTVIEIEAVELVTARQTVYARRDVRLPEGPVWRALADLCGATFYGNEFNEAAWFVNGHEIAMPAPIPHRFNARTYDLAPFLKPGTNVIAARIMQNGIAPVLFMQGRVVMASGDVCELASGPGWRYATREQPGWTHAGFDDGAWHTVTQCTALARDRIQHGLGGVEFWLPPHHGRLVLANPAARDLYYRDTDPVAFEARIPAGLAACGPAVAYAVGRYRAGAVSPVAQGVLKDARADGASLVFRADVGRLTGGVYVVALALRDRDGNTLETQPREPLVVIPTLGGPTVAGRSYAEGLDLEVEDTIDCTDPRDPHPTFETCPADGVIQTPVIVRKPGLEYREAASWRRGAGFSYRLEFRHPGAFYLVEVEYPDDAKRIVEVLINGKREGVWNNVQSSSGAETGGRHLATGGIQTLQWLHVADPGVHSLDFVNHRNYEKVAARRVRISRVRGRLPALDAGASRRFGQYTENIKSFGGIGNVFGVGRVGPSDNPADYKQELVRPLMDWHLRTLEWWFETCDRYLQYNRFCGRNLLIMGCYQYKVDLTPFLRVPDYATWRVAQCPRRMLAQFLDRNGMDFFTEIEWMTPPPPMPPTVSDAAMEAGADTVRLVNRDGRQLSVANWMRPEIGAKVGRLVDDLAAAFGDLKRYRGVHTVLNPRSVVWTIPGFASQDWDALYSSYDDYTFREFARDTGVKTGVADADPARFQKRAAWVAGDAAGRERFQAWRAERLTAFCAGMAARLRARRPDLELALLDKANFWSDRGELFERLIASGESLETYLRSAAIDLKSLNAVPGVFVGRWATGWSRSKEHAYNTTQDPYLWLGQSRPEFAEVFTRYAPDRRYVLLYADWNECYFNGPSSNRSDVARLMPGSDWIMTRQLVRCHSQFGGWNAREPLTQALILSDPNILGHGMSDLALPIGHEQELRGVVRVFSHLPAERFVPVLDTGLESSLAIRELRRGTSAWFYVANPCQWPVRGSLAVESEGPVVGVPDGAPAGRGAFNLPVALEPFGVAAWRADGGACRIAGWRTEPLDPAWRARIGKVLAAICAFRDANAAQMPAARRDALEAQLREVEAALDREEPARAWSRLTDPSVWLYYVYEPSCEARVRKPMLADALAVSPARLPESIRREMPPADGARRTLPAARARGPIRVDGALAEPDWSNRVFSAGFWSWDGNTNALVDTGVCALYDDQALTLAFVCADPDTQQVQARARAEGGFWGTRDDALGVMLYLPDKDTYYQFGFNTRAGRFDQQVVVGGKRLYEEFAPEWTAAAKLHGTYWTAEARIPWAALGLDGPPAGLRINVFRSFRMGAVDGGSWSPAPDNHRYDLFGDLKLAGE